MGPRDASGVRSESERLPGTAGRGPWTASGRDFLPKLIESMSIESRPQPIHSATGIFQSRCRAFFECIRSVHTLRWYSFTIFFKHNHWDTVTGTSFPSDALVADPRGRWIRWPLWYGAALRRPPVHPPPPCRPLWPVCGDRAPDVRTRAWESSRRRLFCGRGTVH